MNVVGCAQTLQASGELLLCAQRSHQRLRLRIWLCDGALVRRWEWLVCDIGEAGGLLIASFDGERQLPVEAAHLVGSRSLRDRSNEGGCIQVHALPLEGRLPVDETSDQMVRRSASGWQTRVRSCIRDHIRVGEKPDDLVARQETLRGEMIRACGVRVRLAGLVFRDVIVATGQSGSQ